MTPDELKSLSIRELENLKVMQEKILELTVKFEKELLEEDTRKQLERVRNKALDTLLLLQTELKKRT